MMISEDGKSLDVAIDEVIKMYAIGLVVVINDGHVIGFDEEEEK